jgi:hypothetical protein
MRVGGSASSVLSPSPLSPSLRRFFFLRSMIIIIAADRIKSNFQQITLSEEDMEAVSALGRGEGNRTRFNIPNQYNPSWDIELWGGECFFRFGAGEIAEGG